MTSPHRVRKISDTSLDRRIPSFLGSPRSVARGSSDSDASLNLYFEPDVAKAVKFLHADMELLYYAETGDDMGIERCLNLKQNPQTRDQMGRTALHFAVQTPNIRAIKLLLAAGCLPTQKDSIGMSPLSLCLMRRPSLEVAMLLFAHGAELLPRSLPVDTGLFLQFVMMCHPNEEDAEILRLLIRMGADINDPAVPGGRSALHFAAMSNNCELIKILLQFGANLEAVNHRGQTPRDVAATFKCMEAVELLDEVMMTKVLPFSALLINDRSAHISLTPSRQSNY